MEQTLAQSEKAGVSRKSVRCRCTVCAILCGAILLPIASGCHMVVNPYHDEMVAAGPVTTPSSRGVREANPTLRTGEVLGDAKTVSAKSGMVIHGPLYFEDPENESGSEDGQFAITREDLLAFWTTGLRFEVNTILYPLSLFVTPPWMAMSSDGTPSRKVCWDTFDATPMVCPAG